LALVEEGFDAAYEFPQHAEVLEILIGFFLAGLEEIDVGQSCVFFSCCLEHLTQLLNYSHCPLLILHGVNLWNSQIVEVSEGLLILLWKTLTGDSWPSSRNLFYQSKKMNRGLFRFELSFERAPRV
jgi:hypothetical protein